ncbi:hypothetical protein [Epilithonimonas caeni]|uniref:hypothetical protein n=1 Tax=Epilithonimonas caeni TaxID=365343 RepID=UPI0006848E94|nr:hypothetical protein [Epilithonimonas caeni]
MPEVKSKTVRKSPRDILREIVLSSFENFIYYIQKEHFGYKPNLYPYQLRIVEDLEKVLRGEITREIINLPPRYRKTEIAVKMFIAYALAHNPKAKFIHVSYSTKLALDNSEAIKDIVMSEAYQYLFPEVQIKKDSKAKEKWYTTQGGGVYATSSGGQITGFGAGSSIEEYDDEVEESEDNNEGIEEFIPVNPEDQNSVFNYVFGGAIVIDDANKPEDAWSRLMLSRVNERYDSTIKNRVNSRFTPIINIQQRISKNDLSSHLIKAGGWNLLKLKALDDKGNPLCSKIHTRDELLQLKKENENIFNSQYQQEPQDAEGLMYELIKVDKIEKRGLSISACDPADDGECYIASIFAYIYDNTIWVHDVVFNQDGSEKTIPENIRKAKLHKPYAFWFEKDGLGSIYAKQVKQKYTLVRTFNAKGNKDARIFDKAYLVSKHFRFLNISPNQEYENAINNLSSYEKKAENNEIKDFADICTSLMDIAIKNKLINIYKD